MFQRPRCTDMHFFVKFISKHFMFSCCCERHCSLKLLFQIFYSWCIELQLTCMQIRWLCWICLLSHPGCLYFFLLPGSNPQYGAEQKWREQTPLSCSRAEGESSRSLTAKFAVRCLLFLNTLPGWGSSLLFRFYWGFLSWMGVGFFQMLLSGSIEMTMRFLPLLLLL